MAIKVWVRRTHKWLSYLVGIQVLAWMIGGLYMVAVPLDVIHGDHLASVRPAPLRLDAARLDPAALAALYPGLETFRLKMFQGREVVEVRRGKEILLADAASGRQLSPVPRETVRAMATAAYTGDAPLREVEWIVTPPAEVGARPGPLWAARFADFGNSTLYYSPHSGELVARRHDLWRWFDVAWMFHIFDFKEREDVNNLLLRASSIAGLAFALGGAWLLFYSFRRRRAA